MFLKTSFPAIPTADDFIIFCTRVNFFILLIYSSYFTNVAVVKNTTNNLKWFGHNHDMSPVDIHPRFPGHPS